MCGLSLLGVWPESVGCVSSFRVGLARIFPVAPVLLMLRHVTLERLSPLKRLHPSNIQCRKHEERLLSERPFGSHEVNQHGSNPTFYI